MTKFITLYVVLATLFAQYALAQKQSAHDFLEKDNTKRPQVESILPMQMFNFHVSPYEALGTLNFVDSILYKEDKFILYSFGLTKYPNQKEYYSFCNVIIKLERDESLMELARGNKIFVANVSRNHPNYFGQGTFLRNNYRINLIAFTQRDHDMAIINTKIYDLSKGRTIFLEQDHDYTFILKDHQFNDTEMRLTKDMKEHILGLMSSKQD